VRAQADHVSVLAAQNQKLVREKAALASELAEAKGAPPAAATLEAR